MASLEEQEESLELLERHDQLAAVQAALDRSRAGRGSVVILEAHAGLGKSTLLQQAARLAAGRVASAKGAELERDFPFGVTLQLFEPLISESGADRRALLSGAASHARPLFEGETGGATDDDLTFRLVHGLYWLTSNLSEASGLTLLVDDLHWADRASLRALLYLTQRIDQLPVAILAAVRTGQPDAPWDLLNRLMAHPSSQLLRLAALTDHAVARLVVERHPTARTTFVNACARLTRGNPFLLRELLAGVEHAGIDPEAAAGEDLARGGPQSLLRHTLVRLAGLPPGATALARAVSVLGEDANLHRAAVLARLEHGVASRAADALAATEIMHIDETLAFVHPLVHRTVYDDVPDAERAELHAEAARLLAVEHQPPERTAAHVMLASRSGDRAMVVQLRAAARVATARGADDSAVRYLRRALEEPPPRDELPALLLELGEAEAIAGHEEATARLERALALINEPRERATVLLRLGWMLHKRGRVVEATDTFVRGLAEVGDADAELYNELQAGYLLAAMVEPTRAAAAHARLESLLDEDGLGAGRARRSALTALAGARVFTGASAADVIALVERIVADAADARDGGDDVTLWQAICCMSWADGLEAAEHACDAALASAQRRGAVTAIAMGLYARAWPRYWMGRIDAATADVGAAVNAWSGGWGMYLPAARMWLALCHIERDDLDAAEAALDLSAEEQRWEGTGVYQLLLAGRGSLAMALGHVDEALDHFMHAGEGLTPVTTNPAVLPWRSSAGLAAAALGDRERARALVAEELELARRFGAARAVGIALRGAGLVERGEDSIGLLKEAVTTLARSPAQLELARALVDLGAAMRRAKLRREAREPLRRGRELAERFGAHRLERLARDELLASGARLPDRPLSGLESLTPSERRVAELAAGGRTNREIAQALFVTVKAVQWHLRHIYQKLGIDSRQALASRLNDHVAA